MGSQNFSSFGPDTWVGVPGREMGGDGGLGECRSDGSDELDVAGSTVSPRGEPRRDDRDSGRSLPEGEFG